MRKILTFHFRDEINVQKLHRIKEFRIKEMSYSNFLKSRNLMATVIINEPGYRYDVFALQCT